MQQSNPFSPKPPESAPTRGVATHPGFHTADSEEIAAPYAQAKFESSPLGTDYPVIVKLDMQGFRALPDYDADNQILKLLRWSIEDNNVETLDDLESLADGWEEEPRNPYTTALEALFNAHPSMENPIYALLEELRDLPEEQVESILDEIASGKVAPELLMSITGQYRYMQKVGPDRVLAIGYMKPYYQESIDPEDLDRDDEVTNLQTKGFDIASPFEEATPNVNWVYERPEKPGARIEYHGTSYRRAWAAIPSIMKKLTKPPTPYGLK